MNEFIEKLIGRLSDMFAESEDCVHKMCESKTDEECRAVTCEQCYVEEMKKRINELAEEYNKKSEYTIALYGCDDSTIFNMELTKDEYDFISKVSKLSEETSTYGCMPTMEVLKK